MIFFYIKLSSDHRDVHSFPTRRSSDLHLVLRPVDDQRQRFDPVQLLPGVEGCAGGELPLESRARLRIRSEEHTSELQSRENLVCRLLLEKKNKKYEQEIHVGVKKN